jgi:hypothetical protein
LSPIKSFSFEHGSTSSSHSPIFTLKQLCDYFLIIWTILLTIDAAQTCYAIGLGYVETNPFGFPMGIIFAYAVLGCIYGTVQIVGRMGKEGVFNHMILFWLLLFLIVLCLNQLSTIIKNFMVLSN